MTVPDVTFTSDGKTNETDVFELTKKNQRRSVELIRAVVGTYGNAFIARYYIIVRTTTARSYNGARDFSADDYFTESFR